MQAAVPDEISQPVVPDLAQEIAFMSLVPATYSDGCRKRQNQLLPVARSAQPRTRTKVKNPYAGPRMLPRFREVVVVVVVVMVVVVVVVVVVAAAAAVVVVVQVTIQDVWLVGMSAYLQDAKADGLGLSRGAAVCIEGHHEELIEISFPHLDVPNAFVLARDLRKHPRGNYKGCVIKGYKQGRNAEIEIRKMQQSNELCIKKAPFTRLVKDVVKDVIWFMNAQAGPGQHHEVPTVSAEAITALQVSAEALLVELLRSYNQMAQHANRSTITTRDLVATRNFCSDLSHHLLEVLHGDDRQRFLQVIGMASQQYGRGDWIRARDACLDIPTGTRGRVSHVRGDLLHVLFEGSAETVALEPWMVEARPGLTHCGV